ncbi:MAG: FG-GAP-like repeat-containing protein [Planctomycetota bacterium]|jgi:hypothetical protein
MTPQFVDFNADGHMDIVTATFDGSPWVSYGSKEGFAQPGHIKDKDGNRIIISYFYEWAEGKKGGYKTEYHTNGLEVKAHCISAIATDWDADGDFDLLLGDRTGGLWLQMNEGEAGKPAFTGQCDQVKMGDKAFNAGGKMTNAKMIDWDGDGLDDLVMGTFGDTWSAAKGGGVKWFRNTGEKGKPTFEEGKYLIEASPKGADSATRPDAGCYIDVVDWDDDGDLDLVVGGYSLYKKSAEEEEASKRKGGLNRKPHVWVYLQKSAETDDAKAPETGKG